MKKIDISFCANRFDQWRLVKAGGYISFDKKGNPVFRFNNQAEYEEYMRLNSERSKMA